jgi:hypothetical protein
VRESYAKMEKEQDTSGGSVSVEVHNFDPDRLDHDALTAGVRAAIETTQDVGLRIVVSGTFENYVREYEARLPELAPYVQARVRGQAAGKIMQHSDGSTVLLVDASVVAQDRSEEGFPERVFMHEALHLVVGRRGESTYGRRARLGHELGTVTGAFAGMAGQVGEEYRIERALREAGNPLEDSYRSQLGAMARDYASSLKGPFWAYQDDSGAEQPLQDLCEAAVRGFEDLTPIVAYLIGDDAGAGIRRPPPATGGDPAQWFRDGYEGLYDPLAALPSAATPCPLEQLDLLLDPVADALRSWFSAVGFRWSGGPDDYRFELLDPERLAAQLGD